MDSNVWIVNNFNNVMGARSETRGEMTPDECVAQLFARMPRGTRIVSLHPMPMDGCPRAQANLKRRDVNLPDHQDASYYEHSIVNSKLEPYECVSWRRKSEKKKEAMKWYFYERVGSGLEAKFTCNNPKCNVEPTAVINENCFVSECVFCETPRSMLTRSREKKNRTSSSSDENIANNSNTKKSKPKPKLQSKYNYSSSSDEQSSDENATNNSNTKSKSKPKSKPKSNSIQSSSSEETFEVSHLVSRRIVRLATSNSLGAPVYEYLVRWKGFGGSSDTWEPPENIGEGIMADVRSGAVVLPLVVNNTFEVSHLVSRRIARRAMSDSLGAPVYEYLVRWKGYDESSDTWVPAENIGEGIMADVRSGAVVVPLVANKRENVRR